MAKTRISCPKSHANLRAALAVLSMLIAVCAHAQTARAGSGSNLPAQFSVVPPNSWLAVPNSTIHAVLPVPGADIGYGGPEDITAAWNSGAYDPTRSRLYILGGGHGGYSGNEVYAFDVPTGTMSLLLPPSPWEAMPHPWMCDLHLRSAVSETRPGPGEWLEFDEIPCGLPSLLQSAGRGVATLDVVTDTDTEEAVEAVEYDLIDLAGRRVRLTKRGALDTTAIAHSAGDWIDQSTDRYVDGRPASVHTYGALQYLPALDALWVMSGSRWFSGSPLRNGALLDLRTLQWRPVASLGPQLGYSSAVDPATGRIVIRGVMGYYSYDPVQDAFQTLWEDDDDTAPGGTYDGHSTALDTAQRKVLTIGSGVTWPGGAIILDLATSRAQRAIFTGDTEILEAYAPGLAYDSTRQRLVGWMGGGDVYEFDLNNHTIRKISPAGGTLPPATTSQGAIDNGIYGRWQYDAADDVFLGYLEIDDFVYIYKPRSGAQP